MSPNYKTKPRLYAIWHQMQQRCHNPNDTAYHRYGGRGISVCDRWRDSFEAFFEDMGDKPSGKSIDRIDNDGGYSPDNCRWATRLEQAANRRGNIRVEINGALRLMREIAEEYGLKYHTVYRRLRAGWSPTVAVTAALLPSRKGRKDLRPRSRS